MMDYVEAFKVSGIKPKANQDASFMVNAQRKMNGMKES